MPMAGLSMKSLSKHPALIPLFVIVGAGMVGSGFYLLRLATRSPDVCWDKTNNPEPFEEYAKKQYKFYSPVRDYKKIEDARPKY